MRLKALKEMKTYIPPIYQRIGFREEYKPSPIGKKLTHVPVYAQFIPMRVVLKKFFKIPGIF